jgi:ABC-2 type transport system permease protein
MNLAIIKRFIHDRRTSLIVYCVAALAFALMYTSLFPSLRSQMSSYDELMKAFPKGFLDAMGIEQLNIGNFESYFSAEYLSMVWPILAVIFSISYAGKALAGGIETGAVGLELAQPVSRLNLYFSKYIAGLVCLTLFTIVTILGVIPMAWLFDASVVVANWLKLTGVAWLFATTVYSLAFSASSFLQDRSRVYGLVAGGLLLMYVARVIAGLQEKVDWLRLGSFFYYYDGPGILAKGAVMRNGLIVFAVVSVASTLLGAWWWNRRDISV